MTQQHAAMLKSGRHLSTRLLKAQPPVLACSRLPILSLERRRLGGVRGEEREREREEEEIDNNNIL